MGPGLPAPGCLTLLLTPLSAALSSIPKAPAKKDHLESGSLGPKAKKEKRLLRKHELNS